MKTLLSIPVFLMLMFFAGSCKKTSTVMLNERVDTASVLKLQGSFMGIGSEQVTGQAKIYLQKDILCQIGESLRKKNTISTNKSGAVINSFISA